MSSHLMIVRVLHWITPIAIGTIFSVARLVAICTLQKPARGSRGSAKTRQIVSVVLSAAVLLLFVCDFAFLSLSDSTNVLQIVQALQYALNQFQGLEQQDVTQDIQVSTCWE
jgi:hypothetical protein